MSDSKDLPEIPELTQAQLNRLLTADWLEQIARMVRAGSVKGFDIAWDMRYQKPVGNVSLGTEKLLAPLEIKLTAQIAEETRKAEQAIPVHDISEEIRDHQCDSEACLVCNNRKNEIKS